ncbi:hypothetical protein CAEBREN_08379 [Caenorhabditis brenneri]|uniref:Uncharacterized protein n=1 Tax=Caenorhabditis brenneri TaxID=135651 RepID=G0N1R7_CAEBE|nr:hypothetical protein CAEBREN_08379 [Caenorhabditis brenneri]
MPITRVPTPRADYRAIKRCTNHYQKAKRFIHALKKFIIKTRDVYKFILFIYMTLMVIFVFVVDSESYNVKNMGTEIFALVLTIEIALGAVMLLAAVGILHGQAFLVAPLLFAHVCVLIYGLFNYVQPFFLVKKMEAVELIIHGEDSELFKFRVAAELAVIIIIRMMPVLMETVMIFYVCRIIFSLMLIKSFESTTRFLPSRNNSFKNTHVWSSIRRKISARQVLDSATQNQAKILQDPELICEMSAKFRHTKYPQTPVKVANEDEC